MRVTYKKRVSPRIAPTFPSNRTISPLKQPLFQHPRGGCVGASRAWVAAPQAMGSATIRSCSCCSPTLGRARALNGGTSCCASTCTWCSGRGGRSTSTPCARRSRAGRRAEGARRRRRTAARISPSRAGAIPGSDPPEAHLLNIFPRMADPCVPRWLTSMRTPQKVRLLPRCPA